MSSRVRTRSMASLALVVIGALLLLLGTVAFYAREHVIDREAFADRALEALDDEGVRRVVSREIVVNLVEGGDADLAAARPLLESVVAAVLTTEPFRRVYRRAAVETNRVFFVREKENVLFDLGDAGQVVQFALRSVSPQLAEKLPQDLDVELLELRRREYAGSTLATADVIRLLGILLPLLALGAFAAAVVVAPDRRIAVLRSGVAAGAAGALLAGILLVLRARTLAGVYGEDELSNQDVRDAVGGLFDAFLGDLLSWALVLALFGLLLGAAAAALEPGHVEEPVERLRRRLTKRPVTTWGRALRGIGALVLGLAVALNAAAAVQLVAILAGAYLVFFGATELLVLLQPAGSDRTGEPGTRRRTLAAAAGAAAVVVAALILLVVTVTSSAPDPEAVAGPAAGSNKCNGSVALCELRLNEAVFAGTHNSMSASDSPGWFIANQRPTIRRQLEDGIRLFLIDAHWGVEDESGKVRTDFASEKRDRNRVAKALPPEVLKAAERLAGRLGAGESDGKRELWLCHTVCELGATRMVESLEEVRIFLEQNRGEVVILFVEPYVAPADVERAFKQAGLERLLITLDRNQPLPTLGELVRTNKRVLVLSEKDADGSVPWYLDGFSFVQDTPLKAKTLDELSCDRERGDADSPLLMLNHWADLFPPRVKPNIPFQTEKALLRRARQCERQRGLPVNLLAVDHYEQGELLEATDLLNGERIQALRRRQAAARPG